jgi:hypothetical protein
MYYMAVMDCDDEIHNILGYNKYGRVEIETTLLADEDHFSYERQGVLRVDTILMIIFIFLIV